MLNAVLDNFIKFDIGEAAFYAVFGFVFVFLGIVLLILIFNLLGWAMKKAGSRPKKEKKAKGAEIATQQTAQQAAPQLNGVSPEVAAVIMAAVACYYEDAPAPCEFKVKRIKKL